MTIRIQNLNKYFNHFHVLQNINLDIQKGELIALLGPSGCGKTSLLRIIAGLEQPSSGKIFFNDQDISDKTIRDRHIGYVFQHFALFKHMTVLDNISFGLRVKPKKERLSPQAIKEKATYLLEMVQLDNLANRYPDELSGGQRQRVALARALATDPHVLLLDEPFSALDTKVRRELRQWLSKLHHDIQLTSIFVTHDQEEAMEIADRVVIMNKGNIEQIGSPKEILDGPANDFVYHFLGESNHISIGERNFTFRPHEILVSIHDPKQGYFQATAIDIRPLGAMTKIILQPQETAYTIEAHIPNTTLNLYKLVKGDTVYFKPIMDFEI
ncbi:sulfate/molybdate ABC transporter ATP-binding protein [Commensalibacter oyaizuii]|uniref:Sulfate ABC transporter ATP-binding protein n=1 Tax=Commensalibacter oyaizuii TaxID=3043873 RepID=A0ABT6Q2Q1_9PROT|nr:sulfate ABC transporter ATP-binding protein [Commensalibacter sp. TBRC 16381]MDI2091416.1 sulfate ABC transporter ATP-binding protein [Commensalibacter sp. TBRC 16381]